MLKEVTLCRPNNMVLGRMFDHHMLDMIELGKPTVTTQFSVLDHLTLRYLHIIL
jgi:hypothetical protein